MSLEFIFLFFDIVWCFGANYLKIKYFWRMHVKKFKVYTKNNSEYKISGKWNKNCFLEETDCKKFDCVKVDILLMRNGIQ